MQTYTFTDEQKTTLIAALALAAQHYAQPGIVVDTLAVISDDAAKSVRESLVAWHDEYTSLARFELR